MGNTCICDANKGDRALCLHRPLSDGVAQDQPRVLLGPVVGEVTATTANILLEVDRDMQVVCFATAHGGTGHLVQESLSPSLQLFAEDWHGDLTACRQSFGELLLGLTIAAARGEAEALCERAALMTPGDDDRQSLELEAARCLQQAYRQTWTYPPTAVALANTANLMQWSDNDVLNDFNTSDYRTACYLSVI
eukprot:s504_g1.t1